MQLPAAAPSFTITGRAPAVRQSLQNSACLGRHQGGLPVSMWSDECGVVNSTLRIPHSALHWGRGRKVMHLPCKQAKAGALPAVLHHFQLRGESDSSEPHKLSFRGCNSRPRYQFAEPFGLVAQRSERPVVCGRVEGATPFGSANLLDGSVPKVQTCHPTNIRPRRGSEA